MSDFALHKALIVTSSVKFFESIKGLMPQRLFSDISLAVNIQEAKKTLMISDISVVIINAPLSDGFGLDFALETSAESPCAVLMFVKPEVYENVAEKVADSGILTLQKPNSPAVVSQTLTLLWGAANRYRRYDENNRRLRSQVEELKLISRAKLMLMEQFGMTETQAHRYIEKRAMDSGQTKKLISESIIKSYAN